MMQRLQSAREIESLTEGLLRRADAAGHWPTRVDDIVAAAGLSEPDENPLSASVLARAPKHLRDAIRLIGAGRVRAALDRRERAVYVDPAVEHDGRRSFLRLHETCHELYPWQQALAYADDDLTLSPATRRLFEREANQGAAELLFQRDRFTQLSSEYRVDFGAVAELANEVGASLRATLRRYCETHARAVCGVVLEPSPTNARPLTYRRFEVSMSAAWNARFGALWPKVLDADAFPFLAAVPLAATADDLVFHFPDIDATPVPVRVQASCNRHAVLMLLWLPKREVLKRKRKLTTAA
jgi:hypothetical protein